MKLHHFENENDSIYILKVDGSENEALNILPLKYTLEKKDDLNLVTSFKKSNNTTQQQNDHDHGILWWLYHFYSDI